MSVASFELHKLGWKAFEDLVATIFREVLGQTFTAFTVGPDGGRDGAFYGTWNRQGNVQYSGSFAVQCKHTSNPSRSLTNHVIEEEIPKIARLAKQGKADTYFFVTNLRLSGISEEQVKRDIEEAGAENALVFGSEWINSVISENPRLRRLVPRLYGLGDLTQIVTHQAFRQSCEVLDSLAPDLDCFVPTESYRKCAHVLQEYGFVLILGEPASGKSMIANLLAISAADEWDLQTLILSNPRNFARLWNPDDPGQFFRVDDAFGSTQYEPGRAIEWNHLFPQLETAIDKGARVVFTSRDYIFKSALNHLKTSAFSLLTRKGVQINIEDLTETERQMILYNHLKCGKQNRQFRRAVKPWLASAAATPKFLPEVARRFGDPTFTKGLRGSAEAIRKFFEEPADLLESVVRTLGTAEKAAMALIFMGGGRILIPIVEENRILGAIESMGSTLGDVKQALQSLDDSLVRRITKNGRQYWTFRHPTVQDAFASFVGQNPELIDIYLAGVRTGRMMDEITCGITNVEGVKIIVPPERFPTVLEKIKTVERKDWAYHDPLGAFLLSRCSGEFLKLYFTVVESAIDLAKGIRSLSSFYNPLRLLCRLREIGLVDERVRLIAKTKIRDIAVIDFSCDFMRDPVGQLLTDDEKREILAEVSDVVFSNGTDLILEIETNWDGQSHPESEFSDLRECLSFFVEFGNRVESSDATELLEEIAFAVEEMESQYYEYSAEFEALDAENTRIDNAPMGTSIFDDVDE